MLGLSLTEIILLAIIALVVIGPKQLPEVARNLGRMLNELKRTSNSFTREFRENMDRANPSKPDPYRYDDPPTLHRPADYSQNNETHIEPASDHRNESRSASRQLNNEEIKEVPNPQFPLEAAHDHVEPATVVKKENDPS